MEYRPSQFFYFLKKAKKRLFLAIFFLTGRKHPEDGFSGFSEKRKRGVVEGGEHDLNNGFHFKARFGVKDDFVFLAHFSLYIESWPEANFRLFLILYH